MSSASVPVYDQMKISGPLLREFASAHTQYNYIRTPTVGMKLFTPQKNTWVSKYDIKMKIQKCSVNQNRGWGSILQQSLYNYFELLSC